MKKLLLAIGLVLLVSGSAQAAPVYYAGTGHYYDLIEDPNYDPVQGIGGYTWEEARVEAENLSYLGVSGHLATVTTPEENGFITEVLMLNASADRYWLGGFQPDGSGQPGVNWQWVTGETWTYDKWDAGEPNDQDGVENGQENALEIFSPLFPDPDLSSYWNDVSGSNVWPAYVVEYGGPPVPEPATLSLLAAGMLGASYFLRRRKG